MDTANPFPTQGTTIAFLPSPFKSGPAATHRARAFDPCSVTLTSVFFRAIAAQKRPFRFPPNRPLAPLPRHLNERQLDAIATRKRTVRFPPAIRCPQSVWKFQKLTGRQGGPRSSRIGGFIQRRRRREKFRNRHPGSGAQFARIPPGNMTWSSAQRGAKPSP